ncbi:MAG: DUF371 domain-containing protein [Pyrobaculum sp.]|jgi:hypothetical protein
MSVEECVERVARGEAPRDVFTARGHPNVTARNQKSLEITKDPYLTKRGDCIVACCSEKAAGELAGDVLGALARGGVVVLILDTGSRWDYVIGETPMATPTSKWRIVVRKSGYIDDSTVAIHADKAASDLDRGLVAELRRGVPLRVTIGVCPTV